jgi:DNA-binding Lrp family transcriptional regulator
MTETQLSDKDRRLLAALEKGLAMESRPYARLAADLDMTEQEVLDRLAALQETGCISRFGVVVRHHELGYCANAMVVWDVPDTHVAEAGARLAALPFVTLCYRRPRRLPLWPYNLFCMIHGQDRDQVAGEVLAAAEAAGLENCRREILFSRRRFKQRGARYSDGRARIQDGAALQDIAP